MYTYHTYISRQSDRYSGGSNPRELRYDVNLDQLWEDLQLGISQVRRIFMGNISKMYCMPYNQPKT